MLHRIGVLAILVITAQVLFTAGCDNSPEKRGNPKVQATIKPEVEKALPDTPTFYGDVAKVIYNNCTSCHRPGQAGPFSLITYNDLKKRTKTIRSVVADGVMPPWPADPSYREFLNQRALSDHQKGMILKWIETGAMAGDSTMKPELPDYHEGSMLGEPDMVVKMPDTIHIPGIDRDIFRVVKMPFELEQDTFLRALEFVPGNRQLVHHTNCHLISYAPGAKEDVFEGGWVFNSEKMESQEIYEKMKLANDNGTYPALTASVLNYLPGALPNAYPPDIGGYHLSKKGAFLLNTMHYGPSPVDTFDRSKINLFFGSKPPERPIQQINMGTLGDSEVEPEFVIPADTVMKFSTRYTLPKQISVVTLNPHMHLLGRNFKAYAIKPTRDTIPLIHIPNWDFRWQYFYTLKEMVVLPTGSTIVAEAVFDNTTDNPYNPFMPPKTIRPPKGSMKTTDEMFQFFVSYVDYKKGDKGRSLKSMLGEYGPAQLAENK